MRGNPPARVVSILGAKSPALIDSFTMTTTFTVQGTETTFSKRRSDSVSHHTNSRYGGDPSHAFPIDGFVQDLETPPSTHSESSREILPEILGEIFGWVVSDAALLSRLDDDEGNVLVRLMLVCKLWHDVVCQTHHLWSKVHLSSASSIGNENLSTWLSRAGTTPKTLSVSTFELFDLCEYSGGSSGKGDDICQWCIRQPGLARSLAEGTALHHLILFALHPKSFGHLSRTLGSLALQRGVIPWNSIRALTLSLQPEFCIRHYLAQSTASIFNCLPPALISLDLTFDPPPFYLIDSDIPSLSSPESPPSRYEIPMTTLKRLKSFKISCHWHITRIADLLCHCTGVEHLRISHRSGSRYLVPDPVFPQPTDMERGNLSRLDPILLPCLHFLDLDIRDPVDAAYILHRLRIPNLVNVEIHNDDGSSSQSPVVDYLGWLGVLGPGPGHPPIQSLTIYELYTSKPSKISTGSLLEILSNLPSLSHLALQRVTFDADELLAWVRGPHRHLQAAPRLRTIELRHPDDDFDLEALLQYAMLRVSKSRGSDTLRRIELRFGLDVYPRLTQLYRDLSIVQDLESLRVVIDIYR